MLGKQVVVVLKFFIFDAVFDPDHLNGLLAGQIVLDIIERMVALIDSKAAQCRLF